MGDSNSIQPEAAAAGEVAEAPAADQRVAEAPAAGQGVAEAPATDQEARLDEDLQLVLQLRQCNFQGESWNRFARGLAEYGFPVMQDSIASGEIFRQCMQQQRGIQGSAREIHDRDGVHDLAIETVAVAINAFRDDVLVPGMWDPTRGACLRTFFIGQCVLQFPNVYRRWRRATRDEPWIAEDVQAAMAPQPSITTLIALRRELESLPFDDARMMDALSEAGYSNAEIAKLLDTTERAVASKRYRARRQRGRHGAG